MKHVRHVGQRQAHVPALDDDGGDGGGGDEHGLRPY